MIMILSVVWAVESQIKNRQHYVGGLQTDAIVLKEINATFLSKSQVYYGWLVAAGLSC